MVIVYYMGEMMDASLRLMPSHATIMSSYKVATKEEEKKSNSKTIEISNQSHLPQRGLAYTNQEALLRSMILKSHDNEEDIRDTETNYVQEAGKIAADSAELAIAMIPFYGVSIDIKDISEQIAKAMRGEEVDNFTLYLSVIGIATELSPEVDPIIDLVKAVGKQVPPHVKKEILDAVMHAMKLGKTEQLKAIGNTIGRMLKNINTPIFENEFMRLQDLCKTVFHKFPENKVGIPKLIDENIDRKVFQSLEDFYFALRKNVDDLSDAEVSEIKRLREDLFKVEPGEKMVMVKVVTKDSLKYNTIHGFVMREKDITEIKDFNDLVYSLGLEYPGSKFLGVRAEDVYIRTFESTPDKLTIPYHPSKFLGDVRDYPFPGTGTGFTRGMIPEYRLNWNADIINEMPFTDALMRNK